MYIAVDEKNLSLGILDTTDGVLEYLDKFTVLALLRRGVVISNLSYEGTLLRNVKHNIYNGKKSVSVKKHSVGQSFDNDYSYKGFSVSGFILEDLQDDFNLLGEIQYSSHIELYLDDYDFSYLEGLILTDLILKKIYTRANVLGCSHKILGFSDFTKVKDTAVVDFIRYSYQQTYNVNLGAKDSCIRVSGVYYFKTDIESFRRNVKIFDYGRYKCFTDGKILIKIPLTYFDSVGLMETQYNLVKHNFTGSFDNCVVEPDGAILVSKSDRIELIGNIGVVHFTSDSEVKLLVVNKCTVKFKYKSRKARFIVNELVYNYDLGFDWFRKNCIIEKLTMPFELAKKYITSDLLSDSNFFTPNISCALEITGSYAEDEFDAFLSSLVYSLVTEDSVWVSLKQKRLSKVLLSGKYSCPISYSTHTRLLLLSDAVSCNTVHYSLGSEFRELLMSIPHVFSALLDKDNIPSKLWRRCSCMMNSRCHYIDMQIASDIVLNNYKNVLFTLNKLLVDLMSEYKGFNFSLDYTASDGIILVISKTIGEDTDSVKVVIDGFLGSTGFYTEAMYVEVKKCMTGLCRATRFIEDLLRDGFTVNYELDMSATSDKVVTLLIKSIYKYRMFVYRDTGYLFNDVEFERQHDYNCTVSCEDCSISYMYLHNADLVIFDKFEIDVTEFQEIFLRNQEPKQYVTYDISRVTLTGEYKTRYFAHRCSALLKINRSQENIAKLWAEQFSKNSTGTLSYLFVD